LLLYRNNAHGRNEFKLWAIGLLLLEIADPRDPESDDLVLDAFILQTAQERGKVTGGLETHEEQLGAFDRVSHVIGDAVSHWIYLLSDGRWYWTSADSYPMAYDAFRGSWTKLYGG